jgi:hypothetical protein
MKGAPRAPIVGMKLRTKVTLNFFKRKFEKSAVKVDHSGKLRPAAEGSAGKKVFVTPRVTPMVA